MSAVNETDATTVTKAPGKPAASVSLNTIVTKGLALLSSVRFGIIILVLLVVASMGGMLIMQQNVEGFEKYFSDLTPSQQLVGVRLGLFDIYHTWYFSALLAILSINIIFASIDRFPKAWTFVSQKKLHASRKWLLGQSSHAQVTVRAQSGQALASDVARLFKNAKLKPQVTEKGGMIFVFGEQGVWNRLGAYAVHVALLTIFTGGFLTAWMGREGQMRLKPGTTSAQLLGADIAVDSNTGGLMLKESSTPLPFTVTCTDIEQKLIRPNGSILANNTLDWLTRITINDEYGERQALVHLNEPYDYRGFRFFQASFISNGKARNITLRLTPAQGGEPITVTVPRDGSTTLNDGTRIAYKEFFSEFTVGGRPEQMGSADYNNPVAILTVTPAGGAPQNAFAFPMDLPDNAPIGKPIAGYKFKMVDFERVPEAHVIAVKRDPGKAPFYVGGLLLILTLGSVFFFSHQRVWALIEERDDGKFDVVLGGNTNRNKLAFEDRFNALHESIKSGLREVKQS